MKDLKDRFRAQSVDDAATNDDCIEDILSEIRDMQGSQGGVTALRLSARLLEYAAFELAPELGSDRTSGLILAAADLSHEAECYMEEACIERTLRMALLH